MVDTGVFVFEIVDAEVAVGVLAWGEVDVGEEGFVGPA
jgi:hypothetical protein